MQKILFGIFAHPDDEAFGPAGTLLLETRAGTELHLVTLTAGEAGLNAQNVADLPTVRLEEWHKAGELIGATGMYHFGYIDGNLNNTDHLEITDRIMKLVHNVVADRDDIAIEFMSMDLNGITGHIDHIVAGRSACLAYYRLKQQGLPLTKLRLACLSKEAAQEHNTDFVYMEPGRTDDEIDEVIDARGVLSDVLEIMRCHKSQQSDAQAQINAVSDGVAIDHFIVRN